MEPQMEVRNEVLETGGEGHLRKWQRTWLQVSLPQVYMGKQNLRITSWDGPRWQKPKAAAFRLQSGFL